MLSETEKRGWNALDDAAVRAGGYLSKPKRPLIVEYDYHAMSIYCLEKGLTKMDLSEDDLKMFEYTKPLVYV